MKGIIPCIFSMNTIVAFTTKPLIITAMKNKLRANAIEYSNNPALGMSYEEVLRNMYDQGLKERKYTKAHLLLTLLSECD